MTGGRKAMSKPKLLVAALALAHLTCASVPLTAPSGSSIDVFANPQFVAANGGVSAVTAVVLEPAGTFVPDGTVVFFLTNLGRIDAQAKTKDGFARVTFVSDSRSGKATITAFSGGNGGTTTPASPAATLTAMSTSTAGAAAAGAPLVLAEAIQDTVEIDIGSSLPVRIDLTADPRRITEPRNSSLTANVFDAAGNPVANVPIIFKITGVSAGLQQESLDSGGQPRFTDTNGQAHDTLRTSQNRADPQKAVTVVAILPLGDESDPVTIFIN
jgi:hypothetical protein